MNTLTKVDQLINNLEEQKKCQENLIIQVNEQKQAIAKDDDEALIKVLNDKNQWIQRLHSLENESRRLHKQLSKIEIDQFIERGQALGDELMKNLNTLLATEEESNDSLKIKTSLLLEEMGDFKLKKRVLKNYQDSKDRGRKLFDNI